MKTNKIVKFLFPFWPWKIFRSITGVCILASLIGLSIILGFFKIKITTGITISMAWLPTMITGWFFGPIIGLFIGFIIDSINWLISPGYWFWLYAIQEPLLGFLVGIVSSLFMVIRQSKKHFVISLIINQVLLISFLVISIFISFFYTNPNNPYFGSITTNNSNSEGAIIAKLTQSVLKWVILGILLGLFLIIEVIIVWKYLNWKKYHSQSTELFEIFLFMTIISIISSVVFSFILGPISAIEYFKTINKVDQVPNLVKYGVIYYLFPRVIKEAFKTPTYIIVLSLLICSLNPSIRNIKNYFANSYH